MPESVWIQNDADRIAWDCFSSDSIMACYVIFTWQVHNLTRVIPIYIMLYDLTQPETVPPGLIAGHLDLAVFIRVVDLAVGQITFTFHLHMAPDRPHKGQLPNCHICNLVTLYMLSPAVP